MRLDIGITRGEVSCGGIGYTVIVFLCVALYNVIELTFIIWGYFKKYSGLYFYSFNLATYGILVYSLGFLFKATLSVKGTYAYVTMIAIGWMAMVLGQSLVLWSRLHLVLRHQFVLRVVLWIIIINSICVFVPILVLLYGSNSHAPAKWVRIYSWYENINVSMFSAQELMLSLIYIWETIKLARLHSELRLAWRSRRLMIHLVAVNIIIILLDFGVMGLEYAGFYALQTSFKGFVYSLKLKMEFTILNRLKEMTTGRKGSSYGSSSTSDNGVSRRRSSGATMAQMSTGTPSGGPVYPYRAASWPMQPLPVAYHAYVQGRSGSRGDLETQDTGTGDGTSTENEVVVTSEVLVEREMIPPDAVSHGSL